MNITTPLAETALISACLIEPDRIVETICTPDHFLDPRMGQIWAAILALQIANQPIDPVTVARQMGGDRQQVDQIMHLCDMLHTETVHPQFVKRYSDEIVEAALQRNLRHALNALAANKDMTGAQLLDNISRLAANTSLPRDEQGMIQLQGMNLLRDVLDAAKAARRSNSDIGIVTRLENLDRLITAIPPGVLTLVGARPSMGKSSLLLGLALDAAKQGFPVDFYSLEDSNISIYQRMIAREADVDLRCLVRGLISAIEQSRINATTEALAPLPIVVYEQIPDSTTAFCMQIQRNAIRNKTKLVIVDYIQLLSERRTENRNQEITEISRLLKATAKRCGVAMAIASQLKRTQEARPTLEDLRESGSLEQDAHVVILLHRKKENWSSGETEAIVAKNKNGPTGIAQLQFNGPTLRFIDAKREETK